MRTPRLNVVMCHMVHEGKAEWAALDGGVQLIPKSSKTSTPIGMAKP